MEGIRFLSVFRRIAVYLEMIKVAHTVFALPFALVGMFLAARETGAPHFLPPARTVLFILLAMVGARSAAMGFNRIADADIDARNPRTRERAIPAGKVSRPTAGALVLASALLLVFSAGMLNALCLKLSPVLLLLLFAYSYTKRFTWASHLVLGACLGAAPLAAWIAVTGRIDARILSICFAVLFWVAGFDVLYALQDIEFDRSAGLHSIPRRLGVRSSLRVARAFHLIMAALLLLGYHLFGLGAWYLAGLALCIGVLAYEHSIVREDDLSRLNVAFFNLNGFVSIAYCLFTYLDLAARGGP
ncbi:MAG: UbiA-like polyprenyltransferase [Thermodesulfobacteriota bacterium]